jgi:ankyrin repeat protein
MDQHQIIRFIKQYPRVDIRSALKDGIVQPEDIPDALTQAVFLRRMDVFDDLILNGADINARNRLGLNPLEVAIETLDSSVLKHVLEKSPLLNAVGPDGMPILHTSIDAEVEAALYDEDTEGRKAEPSAQLTSLLLQAGADKSLRNNRGETPLQVAERRGHSAAAHLLSGG